MSKKKEFRSDACLQITHTGTLTDPCVTCRRKRGEKGEVVETVEDVIVRRLTGERIEELKKLIKETQETHRLSFILHKNHQQINGWWANVVLVQQKAEERG